MYVTAMGYEDLNGQFMSQLVCVGLFLCKIIHCNQFSESQKTTYYRKFLNMSSLPLNDESVMNVSIAIRVQMIVNGCNACS